VKVLPHSSLAVATAKTGVAGQWIVLGAGRAAITGAVVSTTLMVWLAVLLLLQASVAVQVRVMLYEPAQAPSVFTSAKVRVKVLPHSSLAVATAKTGVAGQWIVLGAGRAAITGAVVSTTLMVWLAVLLLLQASVAVQVRVTLYEPAQAPSVLTSAKVRVKALPHSSVAVATAKTGVAGQLMVLGAGRAAITGAVLSTTLMVWLAVLLLLQASVAVQVRVTL